MALCLVCPQYLPGYISVCAVGLVLSAVSALPSLLGMLPTLSMTYFRSSVLCASALVGFELCPYAWVITLGARPVVASGLGCTRRAEHLLPSAIHFLQSSE
jgi:hypothetical protein